jgi:restriction endonuclease S subunit
MAGRFYEYSELKEVSGKLIPKSWKISKVKFIGEYLNGFAFKSTHWASEGTPIIRIQNLSNPGSEINRTSFIAPKRYRVTEGDILISWSATLDVFIWAGEEAWLNQHIFRVKVNESNTLKRFFYWSAKWFMGELNESSHGSTMQHLTTDKFGGFNTPLPTLDEQQIIANFLDHEAAKIDTLIEKQQQLIALLKEKRQAVISHAVTKGLNANAPMRDSGVEWLGEVPEHWVSCSLKHYARIVDCKHITAEFFDEGIPLASISEVKEWNVNLATAKLTNEKYYLDLIGGGRKPEPGDIIYSRNATVGEAALVVKNMPDFAMGQDVCLIRLDEGVLPEYILYVLKSGVISNQLDLAMVGSTFKRINVDDIRNFVIALPSYEEQIDIVAELTRILGKYDALVTNAESTVELLSERRTALISAAVTGKIDVRNWSTPEENKNKEVA